jgi:hypothetical protein
MDEAKTELAKLPGPEWQCDIVAVDDKATVLRSVVTSKDLDQRRLLRVLSDVQLAHLSKRGSWLDLVQESLGAGSRDGER